MKCSKCGAELSEDAKFCSYCGNKIEASPKQPDEEKTADSTISYGYGYTPSDEPAQEAQGEAQTSKPQTGKAKGRTSNQWSKLSTYGKIAAAAIAVFVLLGLVALLAGKTVAVVIAIVQIVLAVVSVLMHKGVIKLEQKQLWLKWFILAIAILFTALNVLSYSWGKSSPRSTDRPDVSHSSNTAEPSAAVSTAEAPYGAAECMGQEYSTVKSEFSSAGFTNVSVEQIEDLKMIDAEKVNTVESVSVGGNTDFPKGQEFDKSNEVIIRYHVYKKCNVTLHIDFVPNLMFSKYNVDLLMNDINRGTLEHGEDKDFEFSVDPGEYTLIFENEDSSSVKGEVTLTVDCNLEASYKISCFNDKVSVETLYVDRLTELAEGEVKVDVAASEYEYKNYEEVTTALKTLGFTNIKYEILYDITLGLTSDGTVKSVSIAGQTEFTRGNVFPADAEIIITYHMPEDDDPSNITMEKGASAYGGMNYLEVEQDFKNMGFTNIELEEFTIVSSSHTDGEVILVEIDGWSFDAGDIFKPGKSVYIAYYHVEAPITTENNSDFAALMKITDQTDTATIKAFVNSHIGVTVEFDGCVVLMMKHENYNTRFDVAMLGVDYGSNRAYGPIFSFIDVSYRDMNVSGTDTVAAEMNFRIAGEIKGFSDDGCYIILEPVSLTAR